MRKGAFIPAVLLTIWTSPGMAQTMTAHQIVDPAATQWAPGPVALPAGTKAALLYGDPAKPELFVMRLWLPANFRIPPHTHPKPEIITVISGTPLLGMGTDGDKAKAQRLTPGTFVSMEPNTPHYAFTEAETVIQLSTVGPWAVNYVNPADDPRTKAPTGQERGH
jgi:quercetin dioxygenase-like cupin family protein